MRIARLEVPALCLGNAVGFGGSGAIPLWVAATMESGLLSTSRVGWLATGELLALAISVLAASAVRGANPRRLAASASAVIVISNLVAMFPAVPSLVIGRLSSGVAMGALLASVTGIAARRQDAQRVLALMQAAMVVMVSLLFFVSPMLIARFGPAALFAILASAGAVMAVAAPMGLPAVSAPPPAVTRLLGTPKLAPILGCLALGSIFIGQNTVWTYIITIGKGLGIDARTLGVVLAIVPPLAMLGPLAAHRLGERMGLLRPLLVGLVLLAIDIFLVVAAPSPILFCVYAAMLNISVLFCVPYAIALLGRLDASGRFASAAPAFMMIGGSISPALGSKLIGMASFQPLAIVAASCLVLSIALFSVAASFGAVKTPLRENA